MISTITQGTDVESEGVDTLGEGITGLEARQTVDWGG